MNGVNFKSRFDPDGECQLVALDFIYHFLNNVQVKAENLKPVNSLEKIIHFLKTNNFNFIILSPLLAFFSPLFWLLKTKYYYNITFFKSKFLKKKRSATYQGKYVILIEETAGKLYGMRKELWTHFIVFYHDAELNEKGIYDPLKTKLEQEFGNIEDYSIKKDKIINSALLQILIWKK